MSKLSNLVVLLLMIVMAPLQSYAQNYQWKTATSGDYTYKYVDNDPSHARFYTLKNGLTVILSPSNKEPRVQTYIAVKAGSKTDPSTHTGLAHYLEHMLFKGTDKFGSLDWSKEKPILDEIEQLYERYNSTTDGDKRKDIYKQIDERSGEAAKFAIANEYDKMMASMGAKGTNAFTSFEQTVYTEDVPSNAIDKYLAVQAERFRNPVFRIFHTELEAVYEEKNRSLDSDNSKTFEEIFKLLFPNNNYGKQTTIGTIEHLKNPSLVEIRRYFNNYYVPNNMGIIMAGDFNPDEVIKKIDENFAYMQSKPVPPYNFDAEKPIEKPVTSEVFGPEAERVLLGYRFPGASSDDAQILSLVGNILANGSAGLIDLNLVKKQQLLGAYAFPYILKDYGMLLLMGLPTEGQNLDQVKDLLLREINKLKKGDFSDDLITSIINNEKKHALEANESYADRASELMDNFTSDVDWLKKVEYINRLNKITKKDIMAFANKYLNDNYVAVYKRQGEDKSVVKVEKPTITPVTVNRDAQSDFLVKIAAMPENKIQPVWLDYRRDIDQRNTGKYEVLTVKNKDNNLFRINYYFETGSWSNKLLPLAAEYLEFIGTKKKSSEKISKELYKLASSFQVSTSSESTYISIDGLQENFDKTIEIFDDLLQNCVADQEALDAYKARLKQSRMNSKKNKGQIMQGLISYATYGHKNPFNNKLSDKELDDLKAEDLIAILHDLSQYKHKILYYGPKSSTELVKIISKIHEAPKVFKNMPKPVKYVQLSQTENQVLTTHFDMVQAEVYWIRSGDKYNKSTVPVASLFNEYFGGGMGSIVFQTIRESKALAYSTFAYFGNPSNKNYRTTFRAYVGTQSDKFKEAVDGMNELLNTLPESQKALEIAKEGLEKNLASERITEDAILFDYLNAQRLGLETDIRKNTYTQIKNMTYKDLETFHAKEISHKPYTYCVLAGEGKIDAANLNALGKVKELSLEELFGY